MQYILIALAAVLGRYVELPVWQTALFVAAGVWGMKQLRREWK